jgi:hypothetical protein
MVGFPESKSSFVNAGAISLLVAISLAAGCGQTPEASAAAPGWKIFTSKGGWRIEYPPNWKISGCRQCTDLTAAHIFVMFSDPSSDDYVWVEQFMDKPVGRSVENWLNELEQSANLNARLTEKSISFQGRPALKVDYAHS